MIILNKQWNITKMPKIRIEEVSSPDKSLGDDTLRYVEDLMLIQSSGAYVNQKKQLQELAKKLYEVKYYKNIDNELIARLYLY